MTARTGTVSTRCPAGAVAPIAELTSCGHARPRSRHASSPLLRREGSVWCSSHSPIGLMRRVVLLIGPGAALPAPAGEPSGEFLIGLVGPGPVLPAPAGERESCPTTSNPARAEFS